VVPVLLRTFTAMILVQGIPVVFSLQHGITDVHQDCAGPAGIPRVFHLDGIGFGKVTAKGDCLFGLFDDVSRNMRKSSDADMDGLDASRAADGWWNLKRVDTRRESGEGQVIAVRFGE